MESSEYQDSSNQVSTHTPLLKDTWLNELMGDVIIVQDGLSIVYVDGESFVVCNVMMSNIWMLCQLVDVIRRILLD